MEVEIIDQKCNSCRNIFTLDDKKINGTYYKTCRECRQNKNSKVVRVKKEHSEYECKSCHKIFIQIDKEKTCQSCFIKKTNMRRCNKCGSSFDYIKDKIYCDHCFNNIEKYKSQLLRESEVFRLKLIKDESYENKLRYIETQLHYIYYCNGITGDVNQNLRTNSISLLNQITAKIYKSNLSWQNIKLIFKKPFHLFSDKNDFSDYSNIGIAIIDKP